MTATPGEMINFKNEIIKIGYTVIVQTIQHKLAELKTEICVGRAFADQCLKIHNEKGLDSASASMAKYW